MRFNYTLSDPSQNESDSLPRLTMHLKCDQQEIEVTGLVDSGATVNVLPYEVPLILGQTNFFMEFDVCFYRSALQFEVMQKSS